MFLKGTTYSNIVGTNTCAEVIARLALVNVCEHFEFQFHWHPDAEVC